VAGDVFTSAGPVLTEELKRDHARIDRGIVRTTTKYVPDWTGVVYDVVFRVSYKVDGETLAFEERIGKLPSQPTTAEREKVQERLDAIRDRVHGLISKYGLERRAATHGTGRIRG
jgi:hypothetical protein